MAVRWMLPGSVLGEITLRWLGLAVMSFLVEWWGGRASLPLAPAYSSELPTDGTGPTYKAPSGLVTAMVSDVCRWKGSFQGHHYLLEDLFSLVPVHGISHIVNGFLLGGGYALAMSWCYLGVFPRHSYVGRWQDKFHTRVHIIRCAWVPTAMYHHSWRLRLTLLETHNGWCLSASRKPWACGGPGPPPGSLGQADRWWNPVHPCLILGWRSDDMVCHYD
jgi:hypothetical protein